MSRLLLLAGRRGSGKDAAAAILARLYDAHVDSFADGFKVFAAVAFGLPREWVWGPSELREQVILGTEDPRGVVWSEAETVFKGRPGFEWLRGLLSDFGGPHVKAEIVHAHAKLETWFDELRAEAGREDGLTVRHLLQQLGTEFGRERLGLDVWSKSGLGRVLRRARGGGHPLVVITDGRFANECEGVRNAGGHVILLIDPAAPSPYAGEHQSERDLDNVPRYGFSFQIINDKARGLAQLESTLRRVVSELFPEVKER